MGADEEMALRLLLCYGAAMLYLYMTYALAQSMSYLAPDCFGEGEVQRQLRVWLYTNSALSAGFLSFPLLRRLVRGRRGRRAVHLLMTALGALAIFFCHNSLDSGLFLPLMGALMLGAGYFTGGAHYGAAMLVEDDRRGRFLGLALTLTVLVQYVLSGSGKEVPLLLLLGTLLVTAGIFASCFRQETGGGCLDDDAPPGAGDERSAPPAPQFVLLLMLMASLLAVLHGCGDSMALAFYAHYQESLFHHSARLFFPLGVLCAGCLADFRQRRYLLSVTTLLMLLRIAFLIFTDSNETFFVSECAEYFIDSFCIMCYILYFLDLAPRMGCPELWAGMGRTLALPLTALSANLFMVLLEDFSLPGFVAVYVLLLGLLNLFFYHEKFREWLEIPAETKGGEGGAASEESFSPPGEGELAEGEAAEPFPPVTPGGADLLGHLEEYREKFSFTARETEVLGELLQGGTAAEIAARLGIKERTVRYHIANLLRKTGTAHRAELCLLLSLGGRKAGVRDSQGLA